MDSAFIYMILSDTAGCLKDFLMYILPSVIALLGLKKFVRMPKYVFRKCLHLVAFTCVIVLIVSAAHWQSACLAAVTVAAAAYPVLAAAEKLPWFADLFVQKEPGEIKKSLLLLFFTIAAVTACAWGLLDRQGLAVTVILMWGIGDACAALVGIPFGKHRITWSFTDGKKSAEGSAAMFAAALAAGMICTACSGTSGMMHMAKLIVTAACGTFAELVSHKGNDTVWVPLALLAAGIALGI